MWESIRARVERAAHATFALPATYTPPGPGAFPVVARIRLHTESLRFGDLDREGYAQIVDDVTRVVVDTEEVTPERGGVVEFADGRKYRIVAVIPRPGSAFRACEVQSE